MKAGEIGSKQAHSTSRMKTDFEIELSDLAPGNPEVSDSRLAERGTDGMIPCSSEAHPQPVRSQLEKIQCFHGHAIISGLPPRPAQYSLFFLS
jgi:hypothetical protein